MKQKVPALITHLAMTIGTAFLCLALSANGNAEQNEAYVLGDNSSGQLALDAGPYIKEFVEIDSGVTDVAMGTQFTHYVKADGRLWATGINAGVFGNGSTEKTATPIEVGEDVAKVFGGSSSLGMFQKRNGNLYVSGSPAIEPWNYELLPVWI